MNINPPNNEEPERKERIVPGSGTAVVMLRLFAPKLLLAPVPESKNFTPSISLIVLVAVKLLPPALPVSVKE